MERSVTQTNKKKIFLEILEDLKGKLNVGTLQAGDKLPSERSMAEQLGVSRASVREAIRALEIIGLLHCVQGDGNYLVDDLRDSLVEPIAFMFALSGGDIMTALNLREALELKTAELAAAACTTADAAELRHLLERLDSGSCELDRAEVDMELHYRIANMAGNPLILSTLNAASSLVETIIKGIRIAIMNEATRVTQIDRQHRELVEAIISGDPQFAQIKMKEHMALITEYTVRIADIN
ncbi:MAG: FadR/GntR family transcriptional regulator [Oscillospiraceae bacterium]